MAGRYLNKRDVKIGSITEIIKGDREYYWTLSEECYSPLLSENERFLEEYSDDPVPGTYPNQPYLFSYLQNRLFYEGSGEVFSIYGCVLSAYESCDVTQPWTLCRSSVEKTLDYVIIIMSKGAFAAGIYKKNMLMDTIEMHDRSEPMTAQNEKAFRNKVKAALEKWNAAELHKFICCRREDFEVFDYNQMRPRFGALYHRHTHIPFHTGYPTVSEIKRTNKRLFSIVKHGSLNKFRTMRKKEISKSVIPKVTSQSPTLRSSQDRKAPKAEPLMNPKSIKDIILRDDSLSLQRKLQDASTNSLLSEFLSSFHSATDMIPFLHYAVTKDKPSAVEVLLDLGADPCQIDKNGNLPYELCRTDEMRELFIAKRYEFPDSFNWKRAKVPTADEYEIVLPVSMEPTKEFDPRPKRDAVRMKRRQKLDKKKIHKDDY